MASIIFWHLNSWITNETEPIISHYQKWPYPPQLRGRDTRSRPVETWSPPPPPPPPTPPAAWARVLCPWRPHRQRARLELASVATSLRSVCSHWTNWETIILSNYIPRVWSIFIFISSYLMDFLFPHSVIQDGFMFNIIRVFLLNQGYSASIENDWYRK